MPLPGDDNELRDRDRPARSPSRDDAGRVLFVSAELAIGGSERSLLRMASGLLRRGWRVDCLVHTGGGALEGEIPDGLRLIRWKDRGFGRAFHERKGRGERLAFCLRHGPAHVLNQLRKIPRFLALRRSRYDAVVINHIHQPMALTARFLSPRRLLAFVRTEAYPAKEESLAHRSLACHGERIDRFLCVSEAAMKRFRQEFPRHAERSLVLHNLLGAEEIRRRARLGEDPFPPRDGRLRILTVCRLEESSKGLLRMAEVHEALLKRGVPHDWFLVGDGPDRSLLQGALAERRLTARFHLLGAATNPYPHIRHCDLVAVPSLHEGFCGVVHEAKSLGKAILCTRVAGALEQLEHLQSGYVVANDREAIVEGLQGLLEDDELRERLASTPMKGAVTDDEAKLDRLERLLRGCAN